MSAVEEQRWGLPLIDNDWYAFCQALYKDIEGEDWEEMYLSYKEMSRAAGLGSHRRPESKIPLKNEGSQGCGRRIL